MANMTFAYTSATFTLQTNPFPYVDTTMTLEDNDRSVGGSLLNYNRGSYRVFELSFQNIGTTDYNNLLAMWNSHSNIQFYPYDEVRGTALNYTCRALGNFDFRLVDYFWASGYNGSIILEQI